LTNILKTLYHKNVHNAIWWKKTVKSLFLTFHLNPNLPCYKYIAESVCSSHIYYFKSKIWERKKWYTMWRTFENRKQNKTRQKFLLMIQIYSCYKQSFCLSSYNGMWNLCNISLKSKSSLLQVYCRECVF
jgi:hypothetical protein